MGMVERGTRGVPCIRRCESDSAHTPCTNSAREKDADSQRRAGRIECHPVEPAIGLPGSGERRLCHHFRTRRGQVLIAIMIPDFRITSIPHMPVMYSLFPCSSSFGHVIDRSAIDRCRGMYRWKARCEDRRTASRQPCDAEGRVKRRIASPCESRPYQALRLTAVATSFGLFG